MIKVYHNNRCSKSRCAIQLLDESGKDYEIIKYLENVPTVSELKALIGVLGIRPIELIRKNEAVWKSEFKEKNLSDNELITAMVDYPKLIERPIVINGNKAVIGRPTERILEII